jgi:hypothetical protein
LTCDIALFATAVVTFSPVCAVAVATGSGAGGGEGALPPIWEVLFQNAVDKGVLALAVEVTLAPFEPRAEPHIGLDGLGVVWRGVEGDAGAARYFRDVVEGVAQEIAGETPASRADLDVFARLVVEN